LTARPEDRRVKCESCGQPATVHQTTLVEGQKRELHLCRGCAEERNLVHNNDLNLPAIVQHVIGHHLGPEMDELARQRCPVCGIRYMEFRAQGRLGCPHDYEFFRVGLGPILYRIHRSTRHTGKVPRGGVPIAAFETVRLRQRLRAAVEAEEFHEAARLRDLLRQREAGHEPG
jgi:protein arginine kinase activator